jgi:hypothetical protein
LVVLLSMPGPRAEAALITSTVPAYSGVFDDTGPFPLPAVTVGTFNYTIPSGVHLTSATILGTFGNAAYPNSSGVDVYAGGILVGSCPTWPAHLVPCNTADTPTAWSFNFPSSDFPLLTSGSVSLTAVQTSGNVIRLGDSTLSLSATPEPSSVALMLPSLFGLVWLRRRKNG